MTEYGTYLIDNGLPTYEQLLEENAHLQAAVESAYRNNIGPRDPLLDCHAFISIKYHANGGLEIKGNIADEKFALQLLEHAKDAIKQQHVRSSSIVNAAGDPIVVAPRDVDLVQDPRYKTDRTLGDMKPDDRGDLPP